MGSKRDDSAAPGSNKPESIGQPLYPDAFRAAGRGPRLHRLHWDQHGVVPRAVDYIDWSGEGDELRHVLFVAPQVTLLTPEEVISDLTLLELLSIHRPAAMFDRGKSEWLRSFNQIHLDKCHHYQLLFYDELLEVIAEGVDVRRGRFESAA